MNEVRVETTDGVMTVTLVDVENRNALGAGLVGGLLDAIAAANADPAVRAIVITNEGSTFCAGANLKERSAANDSAAAGASRKSKGANAGRALGGFETLLHEIQTSPTPVIGKIKGHVVGGGNGLAAAVDISIAVEDVKFGFTEVRLGVAPAIISVVCLPKMRHGDAMEAFLRGHRFPATRAAELGLINRAVPADEIDAAVEEVLADLRKGGPNALGFCKRLVYEVPPMGQKEAFQWTTQLSGELFKGEEAAEGMKAFLQKRKAAWAVDPSE
ncbi:MAG: enoyl-CoA hydratase/isomerase family protein [Deltaproteobacteria bacterium]|nr:enoyl-CoA hydratase/isomerase family protein [Deltaproteobacteria bacterium]MBW2725383.1 enoyl-CoA hydratase/isomerase family protein [Deltaproteobacteria bacterium]